MADLNNSSSIWGGLMRSNAPTERQAAEPKSSSRTECIRAILRQSGKPMSAAEILFDAGDQLPYSANTSLVSMLLKWDKKQGRVVFEDELYLWNSEAAAAESADVRAALRLLRKHGYKCKPPSTEIE